jgi:hypothetical protein
MMRALVLFTILILCLPAALAGCNRQPALDRQSVSGTITFRKQPLKWGTISFEPLSGDAMAAAGADIVDGQYMIPKDRGPEPGTYVVRISGGLKEEDNPLVSGPRVDDAIPKDMVPAEHNEKSKLTREVKAGQANVFNFDLK